MADKANAGNREAGAPQAAEKDNLREAVKSLRVTAALLRHLAVTRGAEPASLASWPGEAERQAIAKVREHYVKMGSSEDSIDVCVGLHGSPEDIDSVEPLYHARISLPGLRVEDVGQAVDAAIATAIAESQLAEADDRSGE